MFARRKGKVVQPSEADRDDEIRCSACGNKMTVVRSHERTNGQFVCRHFRHHGDGGGGGGCGGIGGESDRHKEMKEIALHKLQWEFDLAHSTTEQKVGKKRADVYCRFEEPQHPYGFGIVVETQHKNETKDIEAATENFISHGYTVCWVWDEQFDEYDVDLFGGSVVTPWPHAVPEQDEWGGDSEHYITEVAASLEGTDLPLPKMPPEIIDWVAQSIYHDQEWGSLFDEPVDYTDIWCYSKTPATLPPEWHQEKANEWWREQPWEARFWGTANLSEFEGTRQPKATIPLARWLADEGMMLEEWGRTGNSQYMLKSPQTEPPDPPAEHFLIPENILSGIVEQLGTENLPEPDRPPNPFDDVQCRRCGFYWHVSKQHEECPDCDEPVNFEWNIETGRIAPDSLP